MKSETDFAMYFQVNRANNVETNIIKLSPTPNLHVAKVHMGYKIQFYVFITQVLGEAGDLVYAVTSFIPEGKSPDTDHLGT
jgi:hypothetical protein